MIRASALCDAPGCRERIPLLGGAAAVTDLAIEQAGWIVYRGTGYSTLTGGEHPVIRHFCTRACEDAWLEFDRAKARRERARA